MATSLPRKYVSFLILTQTLSKTLRAITFTVCDENFITTFYLDWLISLSTNSGATTLKRGNSQELRGCHCAFVPASSRQVFTVVSLVDYAANPVL